MTLYVQALDRPQTPRLAHRAQIPLNPASVMKLVTTFAALDTLGPQFTWKTRFLAQGTLQQGTLRGPLFIKGSGDPKWVVERIAADLAALNATGLRTIEGDLILDRSVFDLPYQSPSAFDGDGLRPYNATPDGLLVNFKAPVVSLAAPSSGTELAVSISPPIADLVIQNNATVEEGDCGDWSSRLSIAYKDAYTLAVDGRYRRACSTKTWSVAFVDPDSFAPRVLKALLTEAGITVKGAVRYGNSPPDARLLYEGSSLPLESVIADINQFSNNVMARQLFLTLGAQNRPTTTLEHAQSTVQAWWAKSFAATTPPPILDNGSGLSRSERITAKALVSLLEKAGQHPYGSAFEASLSHVGLDAGTTKHLVNRPGMAALTGRAALKTGTLVDVKSIAGYVTGDSGQRYAVVAIINHPKARDNGNTVIDAFLRWVVDDIPTPTRTVAQRKKSKGR
jgi:D-alanyl-D-alanine carboxypeptidase/D-alanyl-D-alanine-endopeptidase (penicillin-binding protein 4)